MTVSAWRIVRKEHLAAAFTGEGSSFYPGRWNSAGLPVVYVAGSVSLALLEMLVHLQGISRLPEYQLIEIQFEQSMAVAIDAARLPRNWRRYPPRRPHTEDRMGS